MALAHRAHRLQPEVVAPQPKTEKTGPRSRTATSHDVLAMVRITTLEDVDALKGQPLSGATDTTTTGPLRVDLARFYAHERAKKSGTLVGHEAATIAMGSE